MRPPILDERVKTIVFAGDSITAADRHPGNRLGDGFVRMFSDMLTVFRPESSSLVINKGIGSHTVSHLLSRWSDDVIEQQPDVVVVQIGINDMTRFADRSASLHCDPAGFGRVLGRLTEETAAALPHCKMAIIPPFLIARPDGIEGSYRKLLWELLPLYVGEAEQIAQARGLSLIDINRRFARLLMNRKSDVFSEDKIHPNATGHFAIADAVFRSLTDAGA